jgi:signal transduction histidine kinase
MTATQDDMIAELHRANVDLQQRLDAALARRDSDYNERIEHQAATIDVLLAMSASPEDPQPVFELIAGRARDICGAYGVTVCEFDGSLLHWRASTGISEDPAVREAVKAVYPTPPRRDLAPGRAILNRAIVHIRDHGTEPGLLRISLTVKSSVVVPLMRGGVPIGTLHMGSRDLGGFSDTQVELLKTFAEQAVIAISSAEAYRALESRTRELSQSLDELRTTQDRLVQTEKLASLGQLTAGIAHEIKNPLNFVNNFSALSAELVGEMKDALTVAPLDKKLRGELEELAQTLKSNLEKVVQHGKRADSIVKNMLQHSREGSGEHRPTDINAIVDESLNLAYHGARAEKAGFSIALQRDLDPSAGMADISPQEITRVLLNLISNGFYATTKRKAEAGDDFKPMLSAGTKNLGDRVEIRIRDNGTGIPGGVKEKIFNPFFTTKPPGEGTGLGLSMSHDIIVKQHGGSIDVETEAGVFTEFKIVLPRTSQR